MANYCCPCGNVFKILGEYETEYTFSPRTVIAAAEEYIASNARDVLDFHEIITAAETHVYLCPECGRFTIDAGVSVGTHLFEAEKARAAMLTRYAGPGSTHSETVPQKGEAALYMCLCGNSFPVGGEHKKHCYLFIPYLIAYAIGDALGEGRMSLSCFHQMLDKECLSAFICPRCGRIAVDVGETLEIYRYEGKGDDVTWVRPDVVPNPYKYIFPESDPPGADPWEAMRQKRSG